MGSSRSAASDTRAIWLAISVLAALYVGTAAGVIKWIGSHDLGQALIFGAGAFAGTIVLILTLIRFLTDRGE